MKNKKKKKSLFEKISTLSFLTLIPFVIFLIYVLTSVFRETNDEVELPKIMIKDIKNVRIAIDEYYRATGTFPNLELVNTDEKLEQIFFEQDGERIYFKDFLKEMDLCLNVALNEKDSINLKHIVFRLVNCTDIAIKTSKLFYKINKKDITHQNILDALQKTSLKEDFNTILKKYNLYVANENCYEEIYLVKKSDFLNNSNYSNKKEVPDSILDVYVDLNIIHIK